MRFSVGSNRSPCIRKKQDQSPDTPGAVLNLPMSSWRRDHFLLKLILVCSCRHWPLRWRKRLMASPQKSTGSAEMEIRNAVLINKEQTSVDYYGNHFGCNRLLKLHNPKEIIRWHKFIFHSFLSMGYMYVYNGCTIHYVSNVKVKTIRGGP